MPKIYLNWHSYQVCRIKIQIVLLLHKKIPFFDQHYLPLHLISLIFKLGILELIKVNNINKFSVTHFGKINATIDQESSHMDPLWRIVIFVVSKCVVLDLF